MLKLEEKEFPRAFVTNLRYVSGWKQENIHHAAAWV